MKIEVYNFRKPQEKYSLDSRQDLKVLRVLGVKKCK